MSPRLVSLLVRFSGLWLDCFVGSAFLPRVEPSTPLMAIFLEDGDFWLMPPPNSSPATLNSRRTSATRIGVSRDWG
ncbi:hypothetical protein B0O80DRAFT_465331 [Mortierella sp. GBAus27b]|nr:hypothetical protein B0O80DRAFT_465331 [Mortierella sp. GBAus27b]